MEFDEFEVPKNLDVIVIGCGIGGLTAAATLAKLGKKVLVLEQDKQAGGLCRTFTEKGFEFDCGFHYVGQLLENSFLKIALDLVIDGQVHFAEQGSHVDTVVIGKGTQSKKYTIYNGKKQMEAHLKKQFPNDAKAVEEFFKIMKICSKKIHLLCMLKMVPPWFARFILWSGFADLISPIFRYSRTSTIDMVKTLTSNLDHLTVFSQIFYGVPPKNSSCMTDALFLHHSKRGVYYPKGGASEIPYHIIQVLENHGGKVLVNAPVSSILVNGKQNAYVDVACSQSHQHAWAGGHIRAHAVCRTLSGEIPLNIAKIRCNMPVKNLYLSGQDVFSGGYSGALHGGLLCASSVVDHCLYDDLLLQQKKLKRKAVKKLE